MDDIVKTLNTTHQVLMTACALIIILCLAPRSGDKFEAARAELRTLRTLDFNDYTFFAARLIHSQRNFIRPNAEGEIVGKEAWDIGFTASPISELDAKFDLNEIYVIDAPRSASKLSEYVDLFEDRAHAQVLSVLADPDGVRIGTLAMTLAGEYVKLRKQTPELPESPDIEIVSIEQDVVPVHLASDKGVTRAKELTMPGDLRFVRPWEIDRQRLESASDTPGSSLVHVVFDLRIARNYVNASTPLGFESASSNFAGAWLLTTAPELIAYDGNQRVFLPNLQRMWDQVASKTLLDAESYCIQKREAATRQVSFLGLTFEDTIISSTGPLVIMGILLYMMVYARNLELVVSTAKDTPGWVAFFTDRVSIAIMFATVFLLPVAATCLTAFIAGPGESLLVLVYFPVVFFLSAQCWQSLRRVRIALFEKKQAELEAAEKAAAEAEQEAAVDQ